jgi:hypothetical protein
MMDANGQESVKMIAAHAIELQQIVIEQAAADFG